MRRLYLALPAFAALGVLAALAADNSTLPVAGGGTEVFANKDIGGAKYPKHIPHDGTGAELFTSGNAGYVQNTAFGAVADAAYAGTLVEKRNGATVRDLTTTETETGNVYVVVPVPASVRSAK